MCSPQIAFPLNLWHPWLPILVHFCEIQDQGWCCDLKNNVLRRLGFSAANSACPLKKDYNTGVPIRRAMFCHMYKAISVQFFMGVCNIPTVAMSTVQCCKKTLWNSKITTDSVTYFFFSILENLIKFFSLTRGMRKKTG